MPPLRGLNKHAPSCQRPWYVEGGGVVQALGLYQTEGLRPSLTAMTATRRGLDRAACNVLAVAGETMVGIGVYTLWTAGTGVVPLTAGALTLLAQEAACGESFIGPATGQERIDGCKTINDGYGNLYVKFDGTDWKLTTVSNCPRLCAIKEIDEEPSKFNGAWGYFG